MSILEQPTDEYSMRHSANLLSNLVRANEGNLSASDLEVINFAYQQLHRGANTLSALTQPAEVGDAEIIGPSTTRVGEMINHKGVLYRSDHGK